MSGRIVIAGASSGVGKTTIASAIMAALRRRRLLVQPFKAGPDYIDPSYHALAAGRTSRNLDSVLLTHDALRSLFARASGHADLAVVEGVMGLFDGRNATDEDGSTAQIAKIIDAPVIVVLDVAAMSRTAGAIAAGLARFDPELLVAGFILNRVGSPTHAAWSTEAVERATGLPVLGALLRDEALRLPERHLGLVPTTERELPPDYFERLAIVAERDLFIDRIVALAGRPALRVGFSAPQLPPGHPHRARIALARDEAFSFYYEDALELLEANGAECLPFSPLRDAALPSGTKGIYLGGGFPELHAAALAANGAMLEAVRRAAARGAVVYGECGGLMYLGRSLTDVDGRAHTLAGVVPIDTTMTGDRLTLGYRMVRALRDSPLLATGQEVRGHEFHWSQVVAPSAASAAYAIAERSGSPEGYAQGNVLASYVHLHLASLPQMATRFVARCAAVGAT